MNRLLIILLLFIAFSSNAFKADPINKNEVENLKKTNENLLKTQEKLTYAYTELAEKNNKLEEKNFSKEKCSIDAK